MSEINDAAAAELRTMQAAWRALRVDWQLSDREVRELLPLGGEVASHPPRDTETRMRILVEIANRVTCHPAELGDRLRLARPALGWLSPLEAMSGSLGDLRGVRAFAEDGLLA